MPFIQPQNVPISFKGGLQSKSDDFQVSPDSLLELENAVFDKIGRLNKRFGYDVLSNNIANGSIITNAFAIDHFNNELNLFDNRYIYTYASQNNNWINRGTAISLINSNNQIIRTAAAQQLNPDSATLQNTEVYAWEDSRGTVRYSVLDTTTSAYLVYDQNITATPSFKPKVVPFNGLFYIFFTVNNNLYFKTIDPDNPSVISNQTAIAADGYADFVYDCFVKEGDNEGLYVVYFGDANPFGELVNVVKLSTSNVITPYTLVTGSIINDNNNTSIGISIDSQEQLWVVWSTGTNVNYTVRQASNPATTILATTLVDSTVSPTLALIESNSAGAMQVFYEVDAVLAGNHYVKCANLTTTAVVTQNATLRSVGLASKAFTHNNLLHINVVHESTLQNTYFTVFLNSDKLTIIGKISPQLAGPLSSNGILPEVNEPSSGTFVFANLIKGQFISESNTTFTLLGVNSSKIDFNNTSKFNSTISSRNLLFVGGFLQAYDGVSVTEQNFHLFPEDVDYTYHSTGGSLSVGQYQYVVVYSWTDKFGQVQYSTPSNALTVTVADATGSVTLTIPTLRLTAKTDVIIKVYRTQVNSVVFQEVTSELVPLENDSTVDTVTFLDTVSDADMAANAPVYTTGGIFPNVAPPSANLICNYQDRVMLSGIEQDSNVIWFSKNKVNNSNFNTVPTEFTTANTISVNPLGGPITGIIEMDGQLIIFKRSSIYVLSGEGPNDAGGGNSFPNPQLISNSVGCDNPNSIVLTKNGVMFQSTKGIWIIPRGLAEPTYLGAGVDTLAKQYTVTSATIDPNDNLVIFTTDIGPALVYEYLINQWATWTNHNAIDSLAYNNLFAFCKSNGDVYVQNRDSFTDGYRDGYSIFIPMKIVTPWMSFGNMQGYQSVQRAYLLGEFKSSHTLKVQVGYDFNPTFAERDTANIDATLHAGSNQWGSFTPWGDGGDGYWGSEHQLYEFQVNFARQRCTSFRILIQDVQTEDYSEGFNLSNMSFDVGVIGGHNRLPATKKATTRVT